MPYINFLFSVFSSMADDLASIITEGSVRSGTEHELSKRERIMRKRKCMTRQQSKESRLIMTIEILSER
jgi:hypothetical protein